LTARACWYSG